MKLLLLNWRDPRNPDAGGAEEFTHQILKRLVSRGIEVTQISSGFKGCEREEVIDGVKIIRLGTKYSVYRKAKKYYFDTEEKFDVIVDEINTIPFKTPDFAKNGERVYALIHQLAREFWNYETMFPLNLVGRYVMEDHWLRRYRNTPVITVSKSTYDDLMELKFTDVRIVHEGIEIEPLDVPAVKEDVPTLVFVGRFKKAKRPDHALEAFEIAKRDVPNLRLWMIGDGYLRGELEKKQVGDVRFFGRIPWDEKNSLVSKAHLLIVPAVREGWGLVVTEANALGTPALGYDVAGLRDSIKKDETGLLCDPDPRSMAKRIVEIINDHERLEKMSLNALKDSRQYDWDRTAEEFLAIITDQVDNQ